MIDIDGPLAGFAVGFQLWAQRQDRRFYPKARTYSFGVEQWGWTQDRWLSELARFAEVGGYRTLPLTPGAVPAVREILDAGHEVTFFTARPEAAEGDTVEWLDELFGGCGIWETRFTRDVKLDGHLYDVAFDDLAKHAESLHATGCPRSVICDRTWSGESPSGLERISSVAGLWASIRAHYLETCV